MEEGREEDEQMHDFNTTYEPLPSQIGHLFEEKLQALVQNDEADFGDWTSLLSEIENTSHNNVECFRKVYDAFLLEFPLCCGYWQKYARHVAYHCNLNEVEKVYERAVDAIPYSVDLWVSFCSFGMLAYEDPADVRRLFERGLLFVGKDYSSHLLWDKYVEFEYSKKEWNRLAYIYINTLRFPTKKLNSYYISFKKLVAAWEEEMACEKNTEVENGSAETADENSCKYAETLKVIRNLLILQDGHVKPSIVKKYLSHGELLYHNSSQMDEKINSYEARILRPYFLVIPLDDYQVETWHEYLDFMEMQGDFDWTVKLYERCLIPCANYLEFWIRYVEFVEAKGGREIADYVLQRAQKVFLERVPAFNIYCSTFKEGIGDVDGARASLMRSDIEFNAEFVKNVGREANMEKRMGNTESACAIYEKAIEMAKAKHNSEILSVLYVKFARFTFVVSRDIDAAIEVFMRGLQEVPCKSIVQEMISFISLCEPGQIPKLDLIITDIIASESVVFQSLDSHECEEISNLFLEFVDLYGTIHEVRKAWERHRKLFPHVMKPITKRHCSLMSNTLSVKEVMGSKKIYDPVSYQACGTDGHNGSRAHISDCKSPNGNNYTPSEVRVTSNLQDDINDNKRREEQINVAEDVEKHSLNVNAREELVLVEVAKDDTNDNKRREEQMNVAEDVEKYSVNVNEREELLVEVAKDTEKQSTNDIKGREELVEVAQDMENQSINDNEGKELLEVSQDMEMHSIPEESERRKEDAALIPEATLEYPKVAQQELGDGLGPPSLENLCTTFPDNETLHYKPTDSHNSNKIPQEATSGAGQNVALAEGNSEEVSATRVSDPIDTKSSTPSQVQCNNSPLHSVCDSSPPESQSNPQVQVQTHPETTQQEVLPASVAYSQNPSSAGNWPQMYDVQSSQSQQLKLHTQLNPTGTSAQMTVTQGHPYQAQANQMFGQYHMHTAQVYPMGNFAWPSQSGQQQAYAYVEQKSGTQHQPQFQGNQQSLQSNEQQYGYIQNSQGIPPHIMQYYQQQYYYLQQQQQQSQQQESKPQQEQKINQLIQMNPSQQQQANQQTSSEQQQLLQQNQQSNQQSLQHQLSQYHQQDQQVQQTLQCQHLLYMQQQQQQQLYLQQQQQYYLQQQQLLQQQQFQQLSQQEQQLLLQQHQQQFLQHQQQQLLQLQQQHQQQLQQLQHQSVRQQQIQQQPNLQHQIQQHPVQQQKQVGASDSKTLNSNIQGDGDKLQKVAPSRSSISPHSHSPANW